MTRNLFHIAAALFCAGLPAKAQVPALDQVIAKLSATYDRIHTYRAESQITQWFT